MISLFPILAFLEFGSWSMLWWLGAASAPVIIHLLSKRRYRIREWAAMRYLQQAVRKRARRVKIEQLLLLLIRTAIILLIVLALAQPYSQQMFAGGPSGTRTHRVLVLDGSFSMAYQAAGKSRFERAKEIAREIVDRSSQGDGFTLILFSEPPQVIVGNPAFDPQAFIAELEAVELPHARANLPVTLEKVEEIVRRGQKAAPQLKRTEVHFISDLGRASWTADVQSENTLKQFRDRSQRLSQESALVLWDVGQAGAENAAVTSLRMIGQYATVSGEAEIEAQVENFGRQPRSKQRLEFLVDGKPAQEEQISLPPRVAKTVRFKYRFLEGGDHVAEVRLADDLLKLDNRRFLSVPVKESIHVLCINGNPVGDPFEGATEFLRIALNPKETGSGRAVVYPEVMTENALLEIPDLNRYECIFICDMRRFTKAEAKRLDTYLRNGGGLVFFLGERVLPDSYNRWLAGEDPQGVNILPAKLGQVISRRADEPAFKPDPLDYEHPVLGVFRGNPAAGLVNAPIEKYYELKIPDGSNTQTVLDVQGNGPLIVEHPVHRGRVLLVATSADASWNELPRWLSYVPVVHELLNFAISGGDDGRNKLVGDTLSTTLRTLAADMTANVRTPEGKREKVSLATRGETSQFAYGQTAQSGVYAAEFGPPISREELFAVNVDTRESDLTKLDLTELKQEVWPPPIVFHTEMPDPGETWVQFTPATNSQWSWYLLYGVLGLLFAETLLAWRFAHHPKT